MELKIDFLDYFRSKHHQERIFHAIFRKFTSESMQKKVAKILRSIFIPKDCYYRVNI